MDNFTCASELLYFLYDKIVLISNAKEEKYTSGILFFKKEIKACHYDDTIKIAKEAIYNVYQSVHIKPIDCTMEQKVLYRRMISILKEVASKDTFSCDSLLDYYINLVDPNDTKYLCKKFLKSKGVKDELF